MLRGLWICLLIVGDVMSAPAHLPSTQLTDRASFETKPAYSPDGDWIAFESNADGGWHLYLIRSDGGDWRQVTTGLASEGSPLWHPTGKILVFHRHEPALRKFYLRKIGLDGRDDTPLTGTDVSGFRPALSHDGALIAFDRPVDVGGRWTHQVFAMRADGSSVTQLTSTAAYEAAPDWSATGNKIVFYSQRDDPNRDFRVAKSEIYAMNADGSSQTRLTHLNANSEYPRWSPDSKWIAFESDADGNIDLFLARADGSGTPINVTRHPSKDSGAAWSPDGRRLVFSSDRDGDFDLYTIDLSAVVEQ